MNFYGAYGEAKTGTMDNYKPVNHGTAIPAFISRGKSVLRVTLDGKVTRYPSVSAAALAATVKQPTMSAWIRDGNEHHGAVWKTDK